MRRLAIMCLVLLAGCASRVDDSVITVYAAASMTDVVSEVAAGFAAAPVKTSFGSSGELARQIDDGAPADVFISASRNWADYLQEKGRLEGGYRVFARNTLVCVVPKGSDLLEGSINDPGALLPVAREADARIAIADEGVPAGEYARASLELLGLLKQYQSMLVGQKDVRAALRAAETGNVAAAFVYATDAMTSDKVEVLFTFDAATHPPIEYYVAVIKGGNVESAKAFVDHLLGARGQEVLKAQGFALPFAE